ncbi:MAG: holo-ACP synthase [Polynucleobacter sp.]|nr:MAG: holo-ACP synthase [Polynucleobacter sp.]
MIYGVGTDILKLDRLVTSYQRTNGRLAHRILGSEEMQVFQARLARNESRGMAYLATRFAAKEAFSKAIGLGMRSPMSWKAVQTLNDASGKPVIKCSGLLEKYVQERQLVAQVSISDEVNMVIAFVILSVHQD